MSLKALFQKKTLELRKKQTDSATHFMWEESHKNQKLEMAINCWHMNDFESEAMWKLYLKSNEGIAIQSTYQRLIDSLSNTDLSIHIGDYKIHRL